MNEFAEYTKEMVSGQAYQVIKETGVPKSLLHYYSRLVLYGLNDFFVMMDECDDEEEMLDIAEQWRKIVFNPVGTEDT